jgi:murein L,D-transpeptidase YcbB/YkuD
MITRRFKMGGTAALLLGLAGSGGAALAQDGLAPAVAPPELVNQARFGEEAIALRAALAQELGGRREGAALSAYAARGFQPIWLQADGGPGDAALILVDVLRRADEHALPTSKYRAQALSARLADHRAGPWTDADAAALEAALTAAFLDYATDVSSGLLDPGEVDRNLHIVPRRPYAEALLHGAGMATNMAAYLEGLAPADPLYRRLVERYRAFRSVAGADIWGPPVSPGPTLRLGDRGPRVAAARARLTAMGDLDPNAYDQQTVRSDGIGRDGARLAAADITTDVPLGDPAASLSGSVDQTLFDPLMDEALRRFQARHGLNQDGLIGPATLAQMNVSPSARAEQIAVNLERLRWLNQNLGDRYILVNQAGFDMQVVEDGEPVFASRVIVGQAGRWQTPEFSETMTHMVVNPTWNVPMSIARDEILPELKEDPSYLAKRGMRLIGAGADAEQIDWSTVTPADFPGRVTQLPGDENALGSVKFMFPNRFAIYLHDTPTKHLFDRDVRAFSHGCVRVEQPHEFAEYLLAGQVGDPGGFFDEVLARGRERRIDLDRPLPVHLTYRSAWIDADGVEQFRGDVYARDRKIADALRAAEVRILRGSAS